MRYRYRPQGNRTPLAHPVLGHLQWDGIYEHPDCAGNPDFEPIDSEPVSAEGDAEFSAVEEPEADPEPGTPENPIVVAFTDAPADKPPAERDADAAQSGRS